MAHCAPVVSYYKYMDLRRTFLPALWRNPTKRGTCVRALTLCACIAGSIEARADSLEDVLSSRTLHNLSKATVQSAARNRSKEMPRTNYEALWTSERPGSELLQWLGATLSGFKVISRSANQRKEYAHGFIIFTNREKVSVELTIQVPHPSYLTMAQYGTLADFNRFRPPALDVVADQTVPIQGIEAKYYRARDGACSLLFPLEKYGIVNLYTQKCSDAPIMMSIAKSLNFARVNQKLTS